MAGDPKRLEKLTVLATMLEIVKDPLEFWMLADPKVIWRRVGEEMTLERTRLPVPRVSA
jgi:hypothetical protein